MAILNNNPLVGASGNQGGYNINNSLRFRSSASAYLSRTPVSAGNQQKFTLSVWIKKGDIGSDRNIVSFGNSTTFMVYWGNSGAGQELAWGTQVLGVSNPWYMSSVAKYRDIAGWYHIVIAVDTTQASSSERTKAYVNGVQVTSFRDNVQPSQNYNTGANSTTAHSIGRREDGIQYLDGYLAEFHWIDGQALTPSSFGSTNATTGVWQPAKYTGSYGTNGFYLPFSNNTLSTYGGYFTGATQNLKVASNAAFAIGTGDFTVEMFYNPSSWGNQQRFMVQGVSGTTNIGFETDANNQLMVYINTTSVISYPWIPTTGTWHHIATVRKSGVLKLYIDGALVASASNTASIAANQVFVGGLDWASGYSANGYISNFRYTNTAVYDGSFTPPSSNLTNIPGTLLLTLQGSTIVDNSSYAWSITNNGSLPTAVVTPFTANITNDASGNNNSWTHNNINSSTPGTTYDAMTDSPTNTSATVANYATLNPLLKSNTSLSSANLQITTTGGAGSNQWTLSPATNAPSSGKWYVEFYIVSKTADAGGSSIGIGLQSTNAMSTYTSGNYLGQQTTGEYNYQAHGYTYFNAVQSGTPVWASYTTGDTIGVAFDLDSYICYWYKNNTLQGSTSLISGYSYAPAISVYQASIASFNAGQRPFSYTPPTGYVALNTYNLPTPTILQGNKYMDATLWTGTGSGITITNASGFKPDLVWYKQRNGTRNHLLFNSVSGTTKYLQSNTTNVEQTDAQSLTSFNSNGFTLGTNGNGSTNGETYVGWQWQAGQGSTSSNTSGSITSTVSVNTTAGFSIVTYTGTGSAATIGHGLGVAPKMIICKSRGATGDWVTYHTSIGAGNALFLNLTDASTATTAAWNNTAPTSSVFSVAASTNSNPSGVTCVAYCFAEIAGFSRFGSYKGNGSTDGPFVYLGFRPKYIIIKPTNVIASWTIQDTARSTYNVMDARIFSEESSAEVSNGNGLVDYLSNGFKPRVNHVGINGSNNTMIYAAFAENPFKNSLAR